MITSIYWATIISHAVIECVIACHLTAIIVCKTLITFIVLQRILNLLRWLLLDILRLLKFVLLIILFKLITLNLFGVHSLKLICLLLLSEKSTLIHFIIIHKWLILRDHARNVIKVFCFNFIDYLWYRLLLIIKIILLRLNNEVLILYVILWVWKLLILLELINCSVIKMILRSIRIRHHKMLIHICLWKIIIFILSLMRVIWEEIKWI